MDIASAVTAVNQTAPEAIQATILTGLTTVGIIAAKIVAGASIITRFTPTIVANPYVRVFLKICEVLALNNHPVKAPEK